MSSRGASATVGQVLGDGAGEQHGVLEQDADLVAQPVERAVARVAAVDEHLAGGRVVEARDQRADRRLARARRPDDRHARPRREAQRDALEHRPVGLVLEGHVAQLDLARRTALGVAAGPVLEHLVGAEHLGDALGPGHVARHARGLLGEVGQRPVQAPRVLRDHDEVADADRARRGAKRAEDQHERHRDRAEHVDDPAEPRLEVRGVHALHAALLAALGDALGLVALAAERLDDAHRRQRLGGERRDLALALALAARGDADLAAVVDRHEAEHRRDRDHRHADQRIDQQGHDDHPDERQDRLGHRAEVLGEQRADRVRVTGEPRHEVALLAAVVVGEREALQVGVHLQAQLVGDALPRPLEPQVARVRRERVEQRDADHRRRR